jgi:enoyl-CoA hydratase/carnithine racemase
MQHIQITHKNHILHLHIAREEKKNALTGAMYLSLSEAINAANSNADTRVIVISAAGKTFTAGNDIADFLKFEGSIKTSPPALFIHAITTNQKPLIAAVNGKAVGIGATMLLHCDLVYASENASFSTPFVDLGLVPEAGASLLLPMRIGYARAAQMLLLGELMMSNEALSAGLINAIIPYDDLLEYTLQKATILASKPPAALLAARTLMQPNQDILLKHIDEELKQFGMCLQSDEAKEAFMAFMGKK